MEVPVRRCVSQLTFGGLHAGYNSSGNGVLGVTLNSGCGDETGIQVEAKDRWFEGSRSAIR
jgi:hypothetical protein